MKRKFGQGTSTAAEVAILMGINLEPGGIIDYSRIEQLLGLTRKETRFRTIVQAWTRRVFREQRLQYSAYRGVGIQFLTEPQALAFNVGGAKRTAKAERRIATKTRAINTMKLSQHDRKHHEILTTYLRARDSAARILSKEIAEPHAITSSVVKLHA